MRLSKVGWLQRFVLSFGGFWWGPPWWKMVDLHHLATDEVGWDRENVYWQFQESTTAIYPLRKGLSKTGLLQGFVLCFGGSDGGPMVTDGRYTSPGHRRGGLRQKNVLYDNFRRVWLVFTICQNPNKENMFSYFLHKELQISDWFCCLRRTCMSGNVFLCVEIHFKRLRLYLRPKTVYLAMRNGHL